MSNPNGHNPHWGPGPGQQWPQQPEQQSQQGWPQQQQPPQQGWPQQQQPPQQDWPQQQPQQWSQQQPPQQPQQWQQQPPQQGWQQQQQPQQPAADRTPRAATRAGRGGRGRLLPVMVAAGLAVGVFAGLMIVRGTGTDEAEAKTADGKDEVALAKAADDKSGKAAEPKSTEPAVTPEPPPPPPPDAAPPEPPKLKLTIKVDPEDAEPTMAVDSKPYNVGETVELPVPEKGEKLEVKVVAKADGYRTFYKTLELDEDTDYTVELKKERSKPRKPRKPKKPRNPSDLLDF